MIEVWVSNNLDRKQWVMEATHLTKTNKPQKNPEDLFLERSEELFGKNSQEEVFEVQPAHQPRSVR